MNIRFGGDNCIMPYQTEAAKGAGYANAGNIREYTLSPEELAEIQRKYGKPGVAPAKHDCWVTAPKSKPLMHKGKDKKPEIGKAKVERPLPEKIKKATSPRKARQIFKPHPHTRDLTAKEINDALKKAGTKEGARKLLHCSLDTLYKYMEIHGISFNASHRVYRDEEGKICSKCGMKKKWEEFHRNKRMNDGHASSCAECEGKRKAARRAGKKGGLS